MESPFAVIFPDVIGITVRALVGRNGFLADLGHALGDATRQVHRAELVFTQTADLSGCVLGAGHRLLRRAGAAKACAGGIHERNNRL
ncbi:hypothetical protein CKO18_07630 [Rhodoferax fermentans]|uniref:Uncharacterized protein n=1 Tax=Rhodoferax fermentans TaxID=28066 RepID=A0A1T1ANX4_RHOFE|nr:hypothetical protein [Rhodoferax fermentans]OOV05809.1 hypothetical protein RF819_02965 [Rhodoferax fermentans]